MLIINGIFYSVMKLYMVAASNMWDFKITLSFSTQDKYIPITSFYEIPFWYLMVNHQRDIKHQSLIQKGAQTSPVTQLICTSCGCKTKLGNASSL